MARIAISYRRSDSEDITGRIFDRLAQRYGRETVFRDIDSIRPGIDFRAQIAQALGATNVLLVVIGPHWTGDVPGADRRIDDEADPVRVEVETALKRDIPIIPVMVGGMEMPRIGQLPEGLRDLKFRHAVSVHSGKDFDHHVEGLIRALDQLFDGGQRPAPAAASNAAPYAFMAPAPAAPGLFAKRSTRIAMIAGAAAVAAVLIAVLAYEATRDRFVPQQSYCAAPQTDVEKKICQNAQLSALDLQLQFLYDGLRGRLDPDRQNALRDEQRVWIKQRSVCPDDACLLDTYRARIAQLKAWH